MIKLQCDVCDQPVEKVEDLRLAEDLLAPMGTSFTDVCAACAYALEEIWEETSNKAWELAWARAEKRVLDVVEVMLCKRANNAPR